MAAAAFWVPTLLTAASAGAQYVNQNNAQNRQNNAEVQAINNQQQIRGNANAQIKALTNQIGQNTPAQIQGKETGAFVDTLRKNAAGSTQGGATNQNPTNGGQSVSALAPVAGSNPRYNADKATSQAEVQDYGQTNAKELSAVDAAVRQRQNEGLAMQTLQSRLNQLGAQSQVQNFTDQLRAQAAGQASPWVSLFSKVGTGLAGGMAKNGWFTNTPTTDTNVYGNGSIGGGLPGDSSTIPAPSLFSTNFRP
jgi:small-conductance mechanosensitive channel